MPPCWPGWRAPPKRPNGSPTTARSSAYSEPGGHDLMPLLSEQNRRKRNLLIIAALLMLTGAAAVFDVGLGPAELPVASNIVVVALFNLNLIVFLLLLVLLFRNF